MTFAKVLSRKGGNATLSLGFAKIEVIYVRLFWNVSCEISYG